MTVYMSRVVYPSRAAFVAAAVLTPDSPMLPPLPARRMRQTTHPDGHVDLEIDGVLVGGTAPVSAVRGEWELWWMTAGWEDDGAFMPGALAAAKRLRAEVMREAW